MPAPPAERPRRILSIVDGELRPSDGETLFSSAQSGWSGFLLERHQVLGGQASRFFWPMPRVIMVATGAIEIEYRAGLEHHQFVAGCGSVTIWPGDYEITSLSWSGDCQLVDVELSPLGLERFVGCRVPLTPARLKPQHGIRDGQLATLMRAMETEARAGCPAGPLYGESLSITLAAYVDGRYAQGALAVKRQPSRLSRRQLSIVLEYVRANLGSRISLDTLAALLQLSPHHFSLLFRNSVGAAPHQYVMGERLREAARLLVAGSTPLAQIAQMVGFASQSHFTEVFRRATGMTPRRYRDGRGSAPPLPMEPPGLRKPA